MQIRGKSFWLALNASDGNSLTDNFSGSKVAIPRGNWVRFISALFQGDPKLSGNFVDDISNVQSVTLVIRKGSATGDLIFQRTQAAADFDNPACTFSQWAAKTSRQFSFLLTDEETNWTLTGWNGDIYFVFGIITAAEGPITVASGKGTVFEDGIGDAGDTVVANPTYLTEAESNARFGLRGIDRPDWRPGISGLTGGGAANLNGFSTVGLPTGYAIEFIKTDAGSQRYQLQATTTAESLPGLVEPLDYDAGTNARKWVQV